MTDLHSELRGVEALGQAHLLLSAAFAAALAAELLKHLLHLLELAEQPVDILDGLAAARRYPLLAGGIDYLGVGAFLLGH